MNWFIIVFFIIAITIFLITKYYHLKKTLEIEEIESFENENSLTPSEKLFKYHGIKIKYLNANQASNLIVKDGEYLQGMNQANLSARGCDSIDDLYNKYKDAFDDITENEKLTIDKFILKLLTNLLSNNRYITKIGDGNGDDNDNDKDKNKDKNNNGNDNDNDNDKDNDNTRINKNPYYNYVIRWLTTISFAKAKNWLESGMPHTLDTTIIMDGNWFIKPRKTTLLHEITHIHQRQSPLDFEDLYPLLGYYYNNVDIKGLESIYPLNRNNPDGMDKYWLWHSSNSSNNNSSKSDKIYWWIGAIFNTAIPSSLGDINMMALKLDRDEDGIFYYLKQNPTKLSNLKEFVVFFGENPNNYHPNEMTAKFAEWFLIEKLKGNNTNSSYNNYEGYKIYKNYFENMLNKYYS